VCFSEASKKPHFSLSIRLKIQPREHGIDERGNFLDWTRPQFLAWAIAEFDTSNALCDNTIVSYNINPKPPAPKRTVAR